MMFIDKCGNNDFDKIGLFRAIKGWKKKEFGMIIEAIIILYSIYSSELKIFVSKIKKAKLRIDGSVTPNMVL